MLFRSAPALHPPPAPGFELRIGLISELLDCNGEVFVGRPDTGAGAMLLRSVQRPQPGHPRHRQPASIEVLFHLVVPLAGIKSLNFDEIRLPLGNRSWQRRDGFSEAVRHGPARKAQCAGVRHHPRPGWLLRLRASQTSSSRPRCVHIYGVGRLPTLLQYVRLTVVALWVGRWYAPSESFCDR